MVNAVYETLSVLPYPVRQGWYDENMNETHVTFCIALESPEDYEDDDEVTMNYVIQVDVWSKEDHEGIVKEIKKIMKKNEFTHIDSVDLFETDTKIYHKAMRFNYYKEVE